MSNVTVLILILGLVLFLAVYRLWFYRSRYKRMMDQDRDYPGWD